MDNFITVTSYRDLKKTIINTKNIIQITDTEVCRHIILNKVDRVEEVYVCETIEELNKLIEGADKVQCAKPLYD